MIADTQIGSKLRGLSLLAIVSETSRAGTAAFGTLQNLQRFGMQNVPTAKNLHSHIFRKSTNSVGASNWHGNCNITNICCCDRTSSLKALELFGYGAETFTSEEARHIGKFERAHRGTLFLFCDWQPPIQCSTEKE